MKNKTYFIAIVYLVFFISGSLYGTGERTMRLNGGSLWSMADYRAGIIEAGLVRPTPVLVLSSAHSNTTNTLDLSLSFDEGDSSMFNDSAGHYRLAASPTLVAVDRRHARSGFGAVLFPGASQAAMQAGAGGPLVIEANNNAALFSANNRINDFSMEFWLHPLNLENGEEMLHWSSVRPMQGSSSNYSFQRIVCTASRNRLQWSFHNFFTSPDGTRSITIEMSGITAVVPRTWSHHLIRFDSNTGMIEYLVNGRTEAIEYATATRRESGEVFTPLTGENGSFVLGGNFIGLMDEFIIHNNYISTSASQKYPLRGGRIETRTVDLGAGNNGIVRLEASGGRTSIQNARVTGEFRQNGPFRFSDYSEMQFFIRTSNNPHLWENAWQPVTPGTNLTGSINGRYVQFAVDFYPSSDGESSPYLEEIRLIYLPDPPPLPPANLTAVALDGAVQLQWRNSPNLNTQGYLVYYGTSSDNFFGEDAELGASPIDVGSRTSIRIDGLRNGVLYYFRVAAYSHHADSAASFHAGEFSREVRARPLQGLASN